MFLKAIAVAVQKSGPYKCKKHKATKMLVAYTKLDNKKTVLHTTHRKPTERKEGSRPKAPNHLGNNPGLREQSASKYNPITTTENATYA